MLRKNIEDTRKEFEKSFLDGEFYNRQTQDEHHKKMLLDSLHIFGPSRILDLGTGTGYLAFPLAKARRDCLVTGLDICGETLLRDLEEAKKEKISNIEFIKYDGGNLPFENNSYDVVMSRYALHHFENLQDTFHEIYRILKPGGQFLFADPTPKEADTDRFIDRYMQIKKDGHVKFYTQDEFVHMASLAGLVFETSAMTKIRFPRKQTDEVDQLVNAADDSVKEMYGIEYEKKEVYTTLDVLNLSFFKG